MKIIQSTIISISHLLRHSTLKISLERFMTISHSFSPSRLSITLGMMRNTFRSLLESPSDAKYPANNLSIWSKRIIHFYMRNETLVKFQQDDSLNILLLPDTSLVWCLSAHNHSYSNSYAKEECPIVFPHFYISSVYYISNYYNPSKCVCHRSREQFVPKLNYR